ncbi:ParA family protein [Rhodopirellula islandica]|uniref:ParA family protein n=1 Tax=Rhodopirellula islandica TaxID=595434 RepID=UPI0009FA4944|nr:ParA family protein [Rhodopirellula islandica]
MIIALVNSKGGVGKSTLAGNLAGWLHSHGHRVVLADCERPDRSAPASPPMVDNSADDTPTIDCAG